MVEPQRSTGIQLSRISGMLLLASLTSLLLFAGGLIRNQKYEYGYMVWNLFLAWIPFLLIIWLLRVLRKKRWTSWQGISLSILWLGFLPNSFYIVTDYIHLQDTPTVDVLYDALMLTSFVITGLMLGYLSLYMFHVELRKRMTAGLAARVIAFVLLACSVAIYLGRGLRWNTWDLFINPAGILFDVSDRLLNPGQHPQTFVTIVTCFILLTMLYVVVENSIKAFRPEDKD